MAEPTYEQVMQALQAADAVGNTADAQQLAQMAASMVSRQPAPMAAQPAQKEAETVQGSFGRRLTSAADITVGGVLPAIAQTVAYPLARFGGKSPEEASAATERIVSAIDKPFGKAFGVSNTPEYQTEGGRQLLELIGNNIQKGTKWISDKTGAVSYTHLRAHETG
jgi:hypothetical protein